MSTCQVCTLFVSAENGINKRLGYRRGTVRQRNSTLEDKVNKLSAVGQYKVHRFEIFAYELSTANLKPCPLL